MFRASRIALSSLKTIKASTGITGLNPHPEPIPTLKSIYSSTLTSLSSLPSTSVYRQATESLTKHRLSIIENSNDDISAVESQLGNMVETVIAEAEAEQSLVGKMVEWKSWENLEQTPSPEQWRYFEPTSDH